ncbi:MAG: helix-turn-helix domain-containing protein [Armatimonadota bacterium]
MLSVRVLELLKPQDLVGGSVNHVPPRACDATDIHDGFEISVVLAGTHTAVVGDLVAAEKPGDVSLRTEWEPHGWKGTPHGCVIVFVFFSREFLADEDIDGIPWLVFFTVPPRDRPRISQPAMRDAALAIGYELSDDLLGKPKGWKTAIRLGVLRLLLLLHRSWEVEGRSYPRPRFGWTDAVRIQPAVKLIQSDLARRVSISEAAAACMLSTTQFRFLFRSTMGISFGQFARRDRIVHCARMLVSADLSLEKIAQETGFVDRQHLHRAFTRQFSTTPARYRKQYRERAQPVTATLVADADGFAALAAARRPATRDDVILRCPEHPAASHPRGPVRRAPI